MSYDGIRWYVEEYPVDSEPDDSGSVCVRRSYPVGTPAEKQSQIHPWGGYAALGGVNRFPVGGQSLAGQFQAPFPAAYPHYRRIRDGCHYMLHH